MNKQSQNFNKLYLTTHGNGQKYFLELTDKRLNVYELNDKTRGDAVFSIDSDSINSNELSYNRGAIIDKNKSEDWAVGHIGKSLHDILAVREVLSKLGTTHQLAQQVTEFALSHITQSIRAESDKQ